MRRLAVRWLVFACVLGASGTVVRAQSAETLFDREAVQEIRLYLNARDVRALRERPMENTFYPADLHWRGERIRNVAVRSRGNGSRSGHKLGLLVDVNRYVAGQRFEGLTSLVLDNLTQDPSMIRERAAMAMFARMGQPAPRNAFARVYINNEYEGLYDVVEPLDADFVARTLGDTGGYLFEYHWLRPYAFEDLGDDLSVYAPFFEPRTHETAAPSVLYAPIREMVRGIASDTPAAWRARVEGSVDLAQLVTMAAIEAFLAETDGVTGVDGANNFYLYRSAVSGRHLFLPWDRDQAFHAIDAPVFPSIGNELVRTALTFPDLQQLYLASLDRCARLAADGGWLDREIRQAAQQSAAPALEDTRKPYTPVEHQSAVAVLLEFARRRSADVLAALPRNPWGLRSW